MAPTRIEPDAGETEMLCSEGAVTVTAAEEEKPPDVAVIVTDPADAAVTSPADETDAIAALLDVQLAVDESDFVVPSLYAPTAENCCELPVTSEAEEGVIASDTRFTCAAVTVRAVEALSVP